MVTHYSFIHPKHTDEQFFYFNLKMDLMLEWMENGKVILYARQLLGKDPDDQ